jgi:hypothetical protein
MYFNDSSNKEQSLYHDTLALTGSQTTTYDIMDFTRDANFALDDYRLKIFDVSGRWQQADTNDTTIPIDTTNLEANQDNYTLENDQLRVSRVRILDKNGDWKTLKPADRRDFDDDQLAETGEPEFYDLLGNSIMLIPIADYDADDGLELTYEGDSNRFTPSDTTKEPGIPRPFHRYISLFAARRRVVAKSIPNKLQFIDTEIQRLDQLLKSFIAYEDRDEQPFMSVKHTTEPY